MTYQRVLNDPVHDFPRYVQELEDNVHGLNLQPGRVPESTFWLVDDGEESILGISRLRRHLSPYLLREGGHIGYDVPPSQRRKGYGTMLLKMTLQKARETGLSRVLVTCDRDNLGSASIILRNGGILENEVWSEDDQKTIQRYWIEL